MTNQTKIQGKIAHFFHDYKHVLYKKGQVILHPGETLTSIYFIAQGKVRQYSVSEEGQETTLHVFEPFTYFPLMLILSDVNNNYYFECLSDSALYIAPKEHVIDFVKKEPDVLFDLTSRFAKGIVGLLEKIDHLMYQHAYRKVVSLLIYLAAKQSDEAHHNNITLFLSHQEIASWIGLQRETVSRQLEKLQKEDIIISKNHAIIIKNINLLKREIFARQYISYGHKPVQQNQQKTYKRV